MVYLSEKLWFPPKEFATEDGLLAIGGDLSADRLLLAYRSGIFPWYNSNEPILWWSPDPRMVLFLDKFKVSKSFRNTLNKKKFNITFNTRFTEVIMHCSQAKRNEQEGTWITQDMMEAYQKLHEMGHAQSIEVWHDKTLVGGLYGIDLPEYGVFCGESMFSLMSNASKVGLYYWVAHLKQKNYQLIDCQIHTQHLESLGAIEIPRSTFMKFLNK